MRHDEHSNLKKMTCVCDANGCVTCRYININDVTIFSSGLSICIVLLSAVVTVITTLSMSAICTNGQVRGGNLAVITYYITAGAKNLLLNTPALILQFSIWIDFVFSFDNADFM